MLTRLKPKYPYRSFLLGMVLIVGLTPTRAQRLALFDNNVSEETAICQKVFPFFALIQRDKHLTKTISGDTAFQRIESQQREQIYAAVEQCENASCYAAALQWSNEDVRRLGDELVSLYKTKKKIRRLVDALRKQKAYRLYEGAADTAFLRMAWYSAAKGVNYIFDIYVKGEKPQYPKIDAIGFHSHDTAFRNHLRDALQPLLANTKDKRFFDVPLRMAINALQLNERNEAIRYEPLSAGLNRLPFLRLQQLQWKAYAYSMILVPGLGPEDPGVSLDSGGAKRCREAAILYRQKLAPFIVVSGGHVHPNKTPYCEAVEMKRYLVEQLGIPQNAVFIEPYARHTTTNIRNVSRMIYWFGMPFEKPVLIATDASQNNYINQGMAKTALRDLGYLPYQRIKKLNEEQTEFYPVLTSLQVNSLDPLDP